MAFIFALLAAPALAVETGWSELAVPGGRATLSALGVPEGGERGAMMIELIRRLHFPAADHRALVAALRDLSEKRHGPVSQPITLPSPLLAETWSNVIFGRVVAPDRLFVEILTDERARLIYHGAAGLDAGTRQWLEGQHDLLRWIARDADALHAFAWFAPAIRVADGSVSVAGGGAAARRWSSLLGTTAGDPGNFVRRLLAHNEGRTAGLYFVFWAANAAGRAFMLAERLAGPQQAPAFQRLVSAFAACYPPHSTAYPFALRSHDAALLLLELGVDDTGALRGPTARRFWQAVIGGASRFDSTAAGDDVDAAWMVEALCTAPSAERSAVFVTLLAGQHVFGQIADADLPDAVTALAARRLYPALFMSLELAGVRQVRTYAAAARHAARLSQIDDVGRSVTALRQFQAALMLTLAAADVDTLAPDAAARLIESLCAVRLNDDRYEGRIADWLEGRWMDAVRPSAGPAAAESTEHLIAAALAGPVEVNPRQFRWEGLDYIVDLAGTARQDLLDVRRRQRGLTIDTVLAVNRSAHDLRGSAITLDRLAQITSDLKAMAPRLRLLAVAEEYQGDGLDAGRSLTRVIEQLSAIERADDLGKAAGLATDLAALVDFLLAHVLPSWAYAPYLGGSGSGALVAGDGSLRHHLGVRTMGRNRHEQRWQLAVSPAARGSMVGSILGIQVGLASWSLRRLSSDSVPAPPAVDGNDAIPLTLTAALSRPRRLHDVDLAALAASQSTGAVLIGRARSNPRRLDDLAELAAMSPWRRAVLPWMIREEPERVEEQFSALARARLGGARLPDLAAWGSVSLSTGSLRLRMPAARVPEAFAGRAADGIVVGQSVDLMLRVVALLADLQLPASLAAPVLSYAMRDYLDKVRPAHGADLTSFDRQARELSRSEVEDYVGALAALGPLRPVPPR